MSTFWRGPRNKQTAAGIFVINVDGYIGESTRSEIAMKEGQGIMDKINAIEIKLPDEPVFDTYSLKEASEDEVKAVEQGKGNIK